MAVAVLDSGGVTFLTGRSRKSERLASRVREAGQWPPVVPSVVVAECTSGDPGRDATTNRLLKACDVDEELPLRLARRAGQLRHLAGRGSAVDAIVVATAEPGGTVITSDSPDIEALAEHALDVLVVAV